MSPASTYRHQILLTDDALRVRRSVVGDELLWTVEIAEHVPIDRFVERLRRVGMHAAVATDSMWELHVEGEPSPAQILLLAHNRMAMLRIGASVTAGRRREVAQRVAGTMSLVANTFHRRSYRVRRSTPPNAW